MEHHFPIMLAHGSGLGGIIFFAIVFACLWWILVFILKWLKKPKLEWKQLHPEVKDTVLGLILIVVLILIWNLFG